MKWRDVAVVGATAAVTALVAGAMFWTANAVATEGAKAEIRWPVLREGGCEITLRADRTAYKPGESPTVELAAANPTGASVPLDATIVMLVQPKASPWARMTPVFRPTWERKCRLVLGAGERKSLSVPTDVKVADNTLVQFRLTVGTSVVNTLPMAVGSPGSNGQGLAPLFALQAQTQRATQ